MTLSDRLLAMVAPVDDRDVGQRVGYLSVLSGWHFARFFGPL
jgi:hypothetical protein